MKRLTVGCLLLLGILTSAYSQQHLKGMKAVEGGFGITNLGMYGNIGGSYYLSAKGQFKPSLGLEWGEYSGVDMKNIYLNLEYYHNVFKIGDNIYFNPGAGAIVQYYMFSGSSLEAVEQKTEMTNFGINLGLEIEIFVVEKVALTLNARQAFLFSDPGSQMYMLGGGLKFSLN